MHCLGTSEHTLVVGMLVRISVQFGQILTMRMGMRQVHVADKWTPEERVGLIQLTMEEAA